MATINQIKANANSVIRVQTLPDSINQDDVADRTDDVANELLVRGIAGVATTAAMSALAGDDYKRCIVSFNGIFEWLASGVIDAVNIFAAAGGGVWSRITPVSSVLDAFNGLSIDPVDTKYVLGQNVGDVLAPAALIDDREIPVGNFELILQSLAAAAATRIGAIAGGRTGIKITGTTAGGAVATFHMNNVSAATYREWQWEASDINNGMLVLNDQLGNFWIMNRIFASISTALHVHQNVTDFTASFFMGVTRSRHVITNRGATAAITITLGSPTGLQKPEFTFTQVNEFQIIIQSDGGAHAIRVGALLSPAGTGSIRSTGPGCSIRLQWMVTAAEWQAIALVGNWVQL